MAFVPKRPWWKFWPVVCWKHRRVVPVDDVCVDCLADRPAKCGWWKRRWHHKWRAMDRTFVLAALVRASVRYDATKTDDFRQRHVDAAWQEFINSPGQEHWHCQCATEERQQCNPTP